MCPVTLSVPSPICLLWKFKKIFQNVTFQLPAEFLVTSQHDKISQLFLCLTGQEEGAVLSLYTYLWKDLCIGCVTDNHWTEPRAFSSVRYFIKILFYSQSLVFTKVYVFLPVSPSLHTLFRWITAFGVSLACQIMADIRGDTKLISLRNQTKTLLSCFPSTK